VHDVLDPRDLVPDEAEQLAHSGYPVGALESEARAAAAAADLGRLSQLRERLAQIEGEAGALDQREGALNADDDAKRLRAAAERAKAERKS